MIHPRLRRLLVAGGLLASVAAPMALTSLPSPAHAEDSAAVDQAEYDQGFALGLEAYRYGLPVVTTDSTFRN